MNFGTLALFLGIQAAAPVATDEITVIGQRLTPETARHYVNEITRPVDGQLPTFRNPVCPQVIGMSAENAALIDERVRKVAKYVKIPVAPAGCAANLRIIVVEDAQKFVSELKEQKPVFFAGMELNAVERLLSDEGPALSWGSVQAQNEDGHTFADNASGRSPFDRMNKNRVDSGEGAVDMPRAGDGAAVMRTRSASIIRSTTRQSVLDSYVVIESAAATGKSVMQLADYATMRALGGAQPPSESVVVDTILTLFDESREAPPSLRASDLAYLQGLYSGSPSMNSVQQLNRITKAVLKTSPK